MEPPEPGWHRKYSCTSGPGGSEVGRRGFPTDALLETENPGAAARAATGMHKPADLRCAFALLPLADVEGGRRRPQLPLRRRGVQRSDRRLRSLLSLVQTANGRAGSDNAAAAVQGCRN